jgi:hypothetical protein
VHRFILTGAPGSGKTAILRHLELDGFGVVEEAATDVIALAQAQGIDEPELGLVSPRPRGWLPVFLRAPRPAADL